MDIQLLSRLITYLIFGWVGYVWAKKLSLPARLVDWFLWLIALILAGTIGVSTQLVNIFGLTMLLQDLLRALVLGVLVNFILRLARPELSESKTKS
jgi:hypothetical protein